LTHSLKSTIKQVVPAPILYGTLRLVSTLATRRARAAFERADPEPKWLDESWLEVYQQRHPLPPSYGYEADSLARRGGERARSLLKLLPAVRGHRILELGCWDGMVSCALKNHGMAPTAVDIRSDGFDPRARAAGVRLLTMSASDLGFADESFDVVFSYDGFEHFLEPAASLVEMIRVTRPQGYIYLDFGPLYFSPLGAHIYRQVTVPYCHLLFPSDVLQRFATAKGLGPLEYDVNGWSIQAYRNLWAGLTGKLRRIQYQEIPDTAHLDLVSAHPSCFKSKTQEFDDLVVAYVRGLFQKRG
jgi:ubiquinone/menaquinone biosynthesis C-methylase UbiE